MNIKVVFDKTSADKFCFCAYLYLPILYSSFSLAAGSMLAHLHELQSENRSMQSRIMELASQREFYIAINTKLQQTLTDHDLVRLPNGVQPIATGTGGGAVGVAMVGDGLHPQHQPRGVVSISTSHVLPPSAGGEGVSSSGIYEEESRIQDNNRVLENSSGGAMLMETDNSDERMSVSSIAIPKEAQDSLLHAHFSSMQRGHTGTGGGGRRAKSSGLGSGSKHSGLPEGLESDPMLSSVAELPNQRNSGGGGTSGRAGAYSGHSRHPAHDQQLVNNSNNVMSSFSHGSGSSRHSHHHHHEQERHTVTTELLSSSHQLLESSGDRLATPPNNEAGTTPSLNEVTHVTAAVQRPIASFGSPLNDTSPMLSSAVGHPQSSNNVYFHHNPSS